MVQPFDKAEIESVMFVAQIKTNPATLTLNLDGVVTNLARVVELKLFEVINSDIDLDVPFTFSVSNDKLKLEELMLVVKYKF